MGDGGISYQVLTSDTISQVSQYEFNMEKLTVSPKHVKLPRSEEYCRGIAGIDTISNNFKVVNKAEYKNTSEIGSLASRHEKNKGRKSALSVNPKFCKNDPIPSPTTPKKLLPQIIPR